MKKILFFIVHPSKYHLFRITINNLIQSGYDIEICLSNKDVLEDLIRKENWKYFTLFPTGRNNKKLPKLLNSAIYFAKTIIKLYNHTKGKHYDLFITDDLLGIIGKLKKTKTIHFADDDIEIFPHTSFMLHFADYILAPNCTRLGKFTQKKIGFEGFKQSAYLRPEDFKPDRRVLEKYSLTENKYFVIRLVALNASHDIGKTGITNKLLDKIITQLNSHGTVYISSERELPPNYKNLKLKIEPSDILHVINFSTFFICDSQTMSAEAAFLGTPYIRFNDFVDKISYLNELELKYKLGFGIKTTDELNLFQTINSLLEQANLQAEWDKRKANMLKNTINLNAFMTELFIFHSNKTSN